MPSDTPLIDSGWEHLYPERYLSEYYSTVTPDEHMALEFMVRFLQQKAIPGQGSILDFGCGPTVHRSIAAAPYASSITMADLLPANLAAVRAWLSQTPGAHNWHQYTTKILSVEGLAAPTADQVVAREDMTRTRVQSVRHCDVLENPPLSGEPDQKFDLVIAGFCLEVAVSDAKSFRKALLNVLSLVARGGIIVVMGLHRCSTYTVNGEWNACYPVDSGEVVDGFKEAGCSDIEMQIGKVPELAPAGYTEVFFGGARRTSD
jgi:hypothetical protein